MRRPREFGTFKIFQMLNESKHLTGFINKILLEDKLQSTIIVHLI